MSVDRFRIRISQGHHPLSGGEAFLMNGDRSVTSSVGERALIATHSEKDLRELGKVLARTPEAIGSVTTRMLAPENHADFEADVGLILACLGDTIQVLHGPKQLGGSALRIELGMPGDPPGERK